MNDPKAIAERIVGFVDWQDAVSGFCRCPGEHLHTSPNEKRDCRVNLDGAPTIFCFHASCAEAVAEANRRLRRELGQGEWEITLPGGHRLMSGDGLEANGEVVRREGLGVDRWTHGPRGGRHCRQPEGEQRVLKSLRASAERFKQRLFETFAWTMAEMEQESPTDVGECDGTEQFRSWLKIWPPEATIWCGDVYSSGKPEHATHFRPVSDWYQIGAAMGNFTCGSSFKPGSYQRSNENVGEHRFLVVESDTLSRDEVGAVFAYMRRRLHFTLHAIIDTGGKSLHGWFDAPRTAQIEARLKAVLEVFGCDPKLFTYSQPVRVPGAFREGRMQRVVWLRKVGGNDPMMGTNATREQVDPAVDLGVLPAPFPHMKFMEEIASHRPRMPQQLVEGILHQGCKMILGGTSKSNKSWCLLDLAISVASGQKWWGRQCARMPVVYVNFELHEWAIWNRMEALMEARPECRDIMKSLALWNVRGKSADFAMLRPELEEQLARHQFGLIILDPAYKLLGDRDENANGEVAALMNEFEALAQSTGAAVVLAHHYAKGDSTAKSAIDRMSGAGAWARDPDSILVLTPHEEPDCFTVTSILRNLPQVPEFVLSWSYPLMRVEQELNPEALRRLQGRSKVCTDREFMDELVGNEGKTFGRIMSDAKDRLNMGRTAAARYLKRLTDNGLVKSSGGLYWKGVPKSPFPYKDKGLIP